MEWLYWIVEILIVLLFSYALVWYNNTYSSSQNLKVLQSRKPFCDLKPLGFQPINRAYFGDDEKRGIPIPAFVGLVNGYATEISFDWKTGWNTHPHYRVRVFFDPGSQEAEEIKSQVESMLAQSKLFRWEENWLLRPVYAECKVFVGKFYRPDAQRLVEAAAELSNELQRLGLKAIEYQVGVDLSSTQKK